MNKRFTLLLTMAALVLAISLSAKQFARKFPQGKIHATILRSTRPQAMPQLKQKAAAATGEVKDEHGIIVSPAQGEHNIYARSGMSMYVNDGDIVVSEQSGAVEIVECTDGTVYVKDIISTYPTGTWVKGTKQNDVITIPTGQPVYYESQYDATVSVGWGTITADGTVIKSNDQSAPFTFTIEDGVISLQGTSSAWEEGSEVSFMSLNWDDDNMASGYGDMESVWTKLDIISQVDELPYYNDFETPDQQYSFSIFDANRDGYTWIFMMNTDDNHYARYDSNIDLAADDWLMSPAIRLEAGKLYRVAFDTRSRSSEEKIEMMMGTAATAEAMTTQVIEPTDVDWEEDQTLENRRVSVSQTGYYYFGIHAISIEDTYRLYADNFAVEAIPMEAPDAIADFNVVATPEKLEATITLTAPAKKINGEPLQKPVSIDLMRDGELITTLENVAPGSAQTYVDNDEELTLGTHTYQAIPYNEDGQGDKTPLVSVLLDAVMTVPYVADLKKENIFQGFTVIDANQDECTWYWEEGYYTTYIFHSDNQGDDWLISPRLQLQAGHNYNLIVNALTSGYPERFEAKIGRERTVEAMTTTVIAPSDVTDWSDEGVDYEQIFTVPEDGIYYIGIHAISDADMDHLTLNRIVVENGPVNAAPAAPGLEVTPNSEGDLQATITLTAPTKSFDGSALNGNLTRIDILRDGETVGSIENVAPGSTQTYTDQPEEAGYHTYQAIPFNAEGQGEKSEKVTAYIGVDTPMGIENFMAQDKQTVVGLTWDKVGNVGSNELFVNPARVDYTIYRTVWAEGWLGPELVYDDSLTVVTLRDADSYDLPYDTNEGEQKYEYWVIEPSNEAGVGLNAVTGLVVGTPYTAPFAESFTGGELHYFWDTDAEPMNFTVSSDNDNAAMALLSQEEGEKYFSSGKIDVSTMANPVLLFDVKAQGITQLTVTADADGHEPETAQANATVTEEYATVRVPLSAFKANRYVRFAIKAFFTTPSEFDFWTGELVTTGDILVIDNLRICEDGDDAIRTANEDRKADGKLYTIDGRRVSGKRQPKGIYVSRNHKVAVK